MAEERSVVVVGGTQGLGRDLARHYAEAGRRVVITGRDASRAAADRFGAGRERRQRGVRSLRAGHDRARAG